MKRFFLAILIVLAALTHPAAQTAANLATDPVTDGRITPGEYAKETIVDKTKISYTLSADGATLYIALEAPTAGWVSVGLGSLKMNGAYMVFAYVAKDIASITEETGKGHSHSINKTALLTASAASETNGVTLLEAALPAQKFNTTGSLPVILAYGKKDSRTAMHSWIGSATLQLR